MPCLPRRTLKHDCNMAEEGETPILDIPVGFGHKCHVAVTASDIFLAIMQASGQTWAKFVEILQRFQTWAEFIEICKHLQSTGQKGKAFVLTTLNTQLFRVHGISLKHQNGTLLLRTISIQNPFIRYSFERAWYSFKKMSLSVCVCVCMQHLLHKERAF